MNWVIIIIIALIIFGVVYFYRQRRIESDVRYIAKESMPLWASFAPFKDGNDSASVLYYCHWATQGKKFVDSLEERNTYKIHADSFDRKPDEWNKLIQQSAELEIDDFENKRRLVTALFELDSMKEDGSLPDWNQYFALGHIVTSPESKSAKLFYNYLQKLMESNREIETETINLMQDYAVYNDKEIDNKMSAGLLCYSCLKYAKENPDLETSKTIIELNDQTFKDLKVNEEKSSS